MFENLILFSSAGGGGSGGGGGGGGGIIAIPIFIVITIYAWHLRRKRIKKAEADQQKAESADPTWDDDVLATRVEKVFYQFQEDWSNLGIDKMSEYLTPRYHQHISLMLAAMKQMNRRNKMANVKLKSATLFGVNDHVDNEADNFNVEIKAFAHDELQELKTYKLIHRNPSNFEEIWHFEREGKTWKLSGINQINQDGWVPNYDPVVDEKYATFANENDFFYNADFGWMLMPLDGLLFNDASYGNSDINHHVIGLYHNIIVQFFEYIPLIPDKVTLKHRLRNISRPRKQLAKYTIAHARLPKDYQNIIVEHKPLFFSFTPANMTKVTTEWSDFNKLFNVYATDTEKVTSLELLHPAFIEKLAALEFRVNLEIVGHDLYLYTTDTSADYQTMLQILREAFQEMKM